MAGRGGSNGPRTAWAVIAGLLLVVAGFVGSVADVLSLLDSLADKGIYGLLQALATIGACALLIALGGWAWHRGILTPRRLYLILVALVIAGVVYVVVMLVQRADDVTLKVYNKVTDGSTRVREDTAAYLSSRPEKLCRENGCAVPGPDLHTGSTVIAYCQTVGDTIANDDRTTPVDDGNPEIFESDRWYGARNADGENGFLSEVWVEKGQRGGLGLPPCED